MKFIYIAIIVIFCPLFLVGCQATSEANATNEVGITSVIVTDVAQTVQTLEPIVFETSSPGTITIHGELLVTDPLAMIPSPDDGIFLVPLESSGEGLATIPPFEVGDVPQAEVDERTGEFYFTNIDPGRYVIVVLTKGGTQLPARFYEQGNIAIIILQDTEKGTTIELEYLSLP